MGGLHQETPRAGAQEARKVNPPPRGRFRRASLLRGVLHADPRGKNSGGGGAHYRNLV